MRTIRTELSVVKINKRMKKRGYKMKRSDLSSIVRVYTKADARVMYVFERLSRKLEMKPSWARS
jgi:hypothetical protein